MQRLIGLLPASSEQRLFRWSKVRSAQVFVALCNLAFQFAKLDSMNVNVHQPGSNRASTGFDLAALDHAVERAASDAGVGDFRIANDAGFVNVLVGQPNVGGRSLLLFRKKVLISAGGDFSAIFPRVRRRIGRATSLPSGRARQSPNTGHSHN